MECACFTLLHHFETDRYVDSTAVIIGEVPVKFQSDGTIIAAAISHNTSYWTLTLGPVSIWDVFWYDLAMSQSRKICILNCIIALQFDRHLSRNAVNFPSDTHILTPDHMPFRLCDTSPPDVLSDVTTRPRRPPQHSYYYIHYHKYNYYYHYYYSYHYYPPFPLLYPISNGCVSEGFVSSYSVICYIYGPGRLGLGFHYWYAVFGVAKCSGTLSGSAIRSFTHNTLPLSPLCRLIGKHLISEIFVRNICRSLSELS